MTPAQTGLDEARGALALQLSERSAMPPFIVMDVMEAAAAREAQGPRSSIWKWASPARPRRVLRCEAVKRALDRENLGYTVALGLPALRERIARHYRQRYGVTSPRSGWW